MHPIAGYFINLDRSPDRAQFMQAQLARLGMPWVQRHAAVDGAQLDAAPAGCPLLPGERACFLSHLQVLERAAPDGFTLVLEDDTELSPQLPEILAKALQAPLPAFDIALLECQPQFSLAHVSALWDAASRHFIGASRRTAGVDFMDARIFYKWGTPAYLVPPGGRDRLLAQMRAWLAEGPLLPIDRRMEQAFAEDTLRGAITVPFLATTGLRWHGRSTIGGGQRLPANQLMVLRRLLFAGDLGEIETMAQSFADAQPDPALRMFAGVLRDLAAHQRAQAQAGASPPGRP